MVKISPSVLACDLSRLGDEIVEIAECGADMVHLDVMDGIFVPNITFGMPVIEWIRKRSDIIFDVHLMIDRPERYADRFIDAGADILTFHLESCDDPISLIEKIHRRGVKAAVAIKPATPVVDVFPLLDKLDMVLIMTVEPGYGGQALIPDTLIKVKEMRYEIQRRGLDVDIQVDGGINPDNAAKAISAGANIIVAGSSVFKSSDRRAAIDALR